MKKLLLISFSVIIFFVPGCEEEKSDSDNIFTLTDDGYFSADFGVILHDAANPTSDPIASALVEQGGTIVFTKDSLTVDAGDVSSLIVTTVRFYEESNDNDNMDFLTSNWFVKKGVEWNMVGDNHVIDGDNFITVTIEAPEGLNIVGFYNDVGDSYDYRTNIYESEYTSEHYVRAVDNDEKITITSVAKMDDDNWYFGLLEDQAWVDGLDFTINDWQAGVIDPINVQFTELTSTAYPYMNFKSGRTSDAYAIDGKLTRWLTNYAYTGNPDTLDGLTTMMTTDAMPHTDKTLMEVYWDNYVEGASEPFTRSFYAQYGDFKDGDIVTYKEMNVSFLLSSSTGTMLNIEADDDIDQMRVYLRAYLGDDSFVWYHYFDPNESDRFDVPSLMVFPDLVNADNVDEVTSMYDLRVEDYDNFEGSADIVKSLFEKNNFPTSWTDRHYNYIPMFFDGLLGRQQANNDPEELDSQELDMFGIPISPPRFK
jgi:hypothetical protein